MSGFVHLDRQAGDAVYCLDCQEYRSTVVINMNITERGWHQFKSVKQCSDCHSRNIKEIQPLSTGLKTRTETYQ